MWQPFWLQLTFRVTATGLHFPASVIGIASGIKTNWKTHTSVDSDETLLQNKHSWLFFYMFVYFSLCYLLVYTFIGNLLQCCCYQTSYILMLNASCKWKRLSQICWSDLRFDCLTLKCHYDLTQCADITFSMTYVFVCPFCRIGNLCSSRSL